MKKLQISYFCLQLLDSDRDTPSTKVFEHPLNEMIDRFREMEDSHKNTGTRPKNVHNPPSTNETEEIDNSTSPLIENSSNVFFNLLPQLSQSVFANVEKFANQQMLKPCSIQEGAVIPELVEVKGNFIHEPVEVTIVQEQPKIVRNEGEVRNTPSIHLLCFLCDLI